jgi:hypothetical protein
MADISLNSVSCSCINIAGDISNTKQDFSVPRERLKKVTSLKAVAEKQLFPVR